MAPKELVLAGTSSDDRLFADRHRYDQTYYRYLKGGFGNDLLFGNIGIVRLEGGSGADRFLLASRPGGSITTDFVVITDFDVNSGDSISLAPGLLGNQVEVLPVTNADLTLLNNSFDPLRTSVDLGDSYIRVKQTGEVLAVVKKAIASSIIISEAPVLTSAEMRVLPASAGGKVGIQNFNPDHPHLAARIIEYADLASSDIESQYLSAGIYTTLAGSKQTANKFSSFDFTDPPAPYGTYLNGRVGPLQHSHANELEVFFVVSGRYILTAGMQTGVNTGELIDVEVGPGSFVVGPQGGVHGFRVAENTGPAKIFSWTLPSGLEAFFRNSGLNVSNRYHPIGPNTAAEGERVAFWAGQRGDKPFITEWDEQKAFGPTGNWSELRPAYTGRSLDFRALPTFSPLWPQMVSSNLDSRLSPSQTSHFGEERFILASADQAGDVTGKTAWKGPLGPNGPGGTFTYESITLSSRLNSGFDKTHVVAGLTGDVYSGNSSPEAYQIFYTLDDDISLKIFDQPDTLSDGLSSDQVYTLDALTFVQLPAGTKYSLANTADSEGRVLSILTTDSPGYNPENTRLFREDKSIVSVVTDRIQDTSLDARVLLSSTPDDLIQVALVPTDSKGRILYDSSHSDHEMPNSSDATLRLIGPKSSLYREAALHSAKLLTTLVGNLGERELPLSTATSFTSKYNTFLVSRGVSIAEAQQDTVRYLDQISVGSKAVTVKEKKRSLRLEGRNSSFTLDLRPRVDPHPIGRFNWNLEANALGLLDLTYGNNLYSLNQSSLLGSSVAVDIVTGTKSVSGTPAIKNIGFYQIQDQSGTVFDPITQSFLTPGSSDRDAYVTAALINANSPGKGFYLTGDLSSRQTILEGGYLYAPILQTIHPQESQVYLPYPEVSSDTRSHSHLIANNLWGFNSSPDPRRNHLVDTTISLGITVSPPFNI